MRRLIALTVLPIVAICALTPGVAGAQERPVVFLHGLASSPDAWYGASTRLQQRAFIVPHRPALEWKQTYVYQANALSSNATLSGLPSNLTYAVGHSNGGIVAREWSRRRPLAGIVTLGTPHGGAPLITNISEWSYYVSLVPAYATIAMNAFTRPSDTSWVMSVVHGLISGAVTYAQRALFDLVATLGINGQYPVTGEMRPGSAYLASLNSGANLAREAGAVPRRAGIVSIANNFFYGGPMRAIAPDHADAFAASLYEIIGGLNFWGGWILAHSAQTDSAAIQQAQGLFSLAAHLARLDPLYCAMVSSTTSATCLPNDGVVPYTLQYFPNAFNVVMGVNGTWGPAHTRLTSQSDDAIFRVFLESMQIPARTAGPPPPPPPTPSPGPGPAPGPTPPPPAPGPSGDHFNSLLPGDQLWPGDKVRSTDMRFDLVYQRDGNLVLSQQDVPIWHSGTHGSQPGRVMMQHDGHLVMYDASGRPIWSTGTAGHPGAWLIVQNNGDVVIYSEDGFRLWATNTAR